MLFSFMYSYASALKYDKKGGWWVGGGAAWTGAALRWEDIKKKKRRTNLKVMGSDSAKLSTAPYVGQQYYITLQHKSRYFCAAEAK